MNENTPQRVNHIEQKAIDEDRSAKQANDVVDGAITSMNPQRQFQKDKSQNKR